MGFLLNLIYWQTIGLVLALFAVVTIHLLTGQINMMGLMYRISGGGTPYLSPERVQLLLITLGAAFQYLVAVLRNPSVFPDVNGAWLAVLGGSHAVYLGGKLGASILGKKTNVL